MILIKKSLFYQKIAPKKILKQYSKETSEKMYNFYDKI